MADDLRIAEDLPNHRKVRLMIRRLGERSFRALITLWCDASSNLPDGDLSGMCDEEIACAADWPDDAETFVRVLREVRFLDGEPGAYHLHDWTDRQPYIVSREERRDKARALVNHRWEKEREARADPDRTTERTTERSAPRSTARITSRITPSPALPEENKNSDSDSAPAHEACEDAPTAIALKGAVPDLVLVDGPLAKAPRITLDRKAWRFEGVTDEHRERWQRAAPLVDLVTDQAAAEAWCAANPERAPASRMEKFLVAWFARTQERLRKEVPSQASGLARGRPVRTGRASLPQVPLQEFPEAKRAPMGPIGPCGTAWPEAVALLADRMDQRDFDDWVKPLQYLGDRDGVIVLAAATDFDARWVRDNFRDLFQDALIDTAGRPFVIDIIAADARPTEDA